MKYRLCHIINDDKFVAEAINLFNLFSEIENKVYCIEQKNYRFTNHIINKTFSEKDIKDNHFIDSFIEFDFIIFHNLIQKEKVKLVNKLKNHTLLWIGWGHDYYPLFGKEYALSKTTNANLDLIYNKSKPSVFIKKVAKNIFKIFETKVNFSKINYFAPALPPEYNLLVNKFSSFNPVFIKWNYYVPFYNLSFDEIQNNSILKVLIGNNGSATNNHLDSIIALKKIQGYSLCISVPMGYSGDSRYINYIEKFGKNIFKNFNILKSFISLNEYNLLLSKFDLAIFNSHRQQGMVTINALLCNGTKVFLEEKNTCFVFYKSLGLKIFSINELNNTDVLVLKRKDLAIHNRPIILNYFGYESAVNKTRDLIHALIEKKKGS